MATEKKGEVFAFTSSVLNAIVASFSQTINQYLINATDHTMLRAVYLIFGVTLALWWYEQTPKMRNMRGILMNVVTFSVVSWAVDTFFIKGVDSFALSVVSYIILLTTVQTFSQSIKNKNEVVEIFEALCQNSKFVFTQNLTLLLSQFENKIVTPLVALTFWAVGQIAVVQDQLVQDVVYAMTISVIKNGVLDVIPLTLKIPTHIIFLCFVYPLMKLDGMHTVYSLVLYTSSQYNADLIRAEFNPSVSALFVTVIAIIAKNTTLGDLATVTATVLLTDLFLQVVFSNGRDDHFLTLLLAGMGVQFLLELTISKHL